MDKRELKPLDVLLGVCIVGIFCLLCGIAVVYRIATGKELELFPEQEEEGNGY